MADWRLDILSTRAEEAEIWRRAVEGLPETARDVYYLPEFARIVENGPEEPVFLARYGNAETYLLNIFARRGTSDLPFCNGSERRFADIVTPYGYGGPAMTCTSWPMRASSRET